MERNDKGETPSRREFLTLAVVSAPAVAAVASASPAAAAETAGASSASTGTPAQVLTYYQAARF